MTQAGLHNYIKQYLQTKTTHFDITENEGNYLICFPRHAEAPFPVLCSHLDTVGVYPPDEIIEENGFYLGRYAKRPCVLGGDDRNGVWAMLKLIEAENHNWGYIFCWNEEVGCLGARALVGTGFLQNNIDKIAYFVALDRRGTSDLAYYLFTVNGKLLHSADNPDFLAGLEKLKGYSVKKGTSTDIVQFCSATGLCGINISSGFFQEHSSNESSDIAYVSDLPARVSQIISYLGFSQYQMAQ